MYKMCHFVECFDADRRFLLGNVVSCIAATGVLEHPARSAREIYGKGEPQPSWERKGSYAHLENPLIKLREAKFGLA
jgi:hypothetical protein